MYFSARLLDQTTVDISALYCTRESAWVMGYAVTLWEGHDHG